MAEAIGLAASIVGIASAGVSVVSTLTKFGISFRGSNDKINSLAGRVSLTASILSDIATTVEQNASGFKKEEFWRTWRKVLRSCEESYGRLEKALLKARRSGPSKGKTGGDGVTVWGKLVWALGGENEMQDLETSLERCCQQVMMMQQAVQMSVLSLIARRQKLSSDEIEDQRELMSKLQWLLSTLSGAGVLPTGKVKGRSVIVVDEDPVEPPKDFLMNSDPSTDRSRAFDPSDERDVPISMAGDLGGGGNHLGMNSFAVHSVLPQSRGRTRSSQNGSIASMKKTGASNTKNGEAVVEKEHFFEAYYIIPRSVPRTQPRGQIQLIKPMPDDYMIICLDTKQDYRTDPNLRNAMRRAKRARDSVTPSIANDFPRSVQEAAFSLANYKKRHGNGLTWTLVEGRELGCLEESMFRKSSAKSGFLIVLRGSGLRRYNDSSAIPPSSPALPSILKKTQSVAQEVKASQKNRSESTQQKTTEMSMSPPSSPRVSFESSRRDNFKKERATVKRPVVVQKNEPESKTNNSTQESGWGLWGYRKDKKNKDKDKDKDSSDAASDESDSEVFGRTPSREERIAAQDSEIRRRPAVQTPPRRESIPIWGHATSLDDGFEIRAREKVRQLAKYERERERIKEDEESRRGERRFQSFERRSPAPAQGTSPTANAESLPDDGREILSGAALGALDSESITRTRPHSREEDRSKSRSRHRATQSAQAGYSSAGVAGVVQYLSKRPRRRSRERSRSRQRIGAEIARAGLSGAAVAGLYETLKAKAERGERAQRPAREDESGPSTPPVVDSDTELGMVTYGMDPTYGSQATSFGPENDAGVRAASRTTIARTRRDDGLTITIPQSAKDDRDVQATHGKSELTTSPRPELPFARPMGGSERLSSDSQSDSEATISDFSSPSGDEGSTLVEGQKGDEAETLYLTRSEAQAMMMNFLATFTTV